MLDASEPVLTDVHQRTLVLLDRLVAFRTMPGETNRELIDFVRDYLHGHGIVSSLSSDETGERFNLFATVGPEVDGGVMLNGHTDVVPTEGQEWTGDPFRMRRVDGRLIGRGTVDMKGFLACALAMVPEFAAMPLARPVHVSMCYDEEIGGFGAPVLAQDIVGKAYRPALAIVGEPTRMAIVAAHKGGLEMRTEITGRAAHACDPDKGISAISIAASMIDHLRVVAERLASSPDPDCPFEPPHATINVGTIHGGAARNIVAGDCAFDWEIRPTRAGEAEQLLAEIEAYARSRILPAGAEMTTNIEARVPPLSYDPGSKAVALVRLLTGQNAVETVSFGTDAGHFEAVGMSTVVFGPGSIDQAHKPDEFITEEQIRACLAFLFRLGHSLEN